MASNTPSTLGHMARPHAGPNIADGLRKRVRTVEGMGPDYSRQATRLRELAEHVASLPPTDERLYVLDKAALSPGQGAWEPGPEQKRLIGSLGAKLAGVTPDRALSELAAASVDDALADVEHLKGRVRRLQGKVDESDGIAREVAATNDLMGAQVERSNAALGESKEKIKQLEAQIDYLESAKQSTDWRAVSGQPNVYEKANAAGETIYRVGWREGQKQRWETVGTDFDEAVKVRDERHTVVV